ncbi:MAG: ATP-dependent nuclease [Bacteroidota bacterium]
MKANNAFKGYIEYIRFPFFRNLEKDSKIVFDFPLTFFVGKNGGGKSSTLQSLYGCPSGKSLGDYWFSTDLDPIKESAERNCLIYASIQKNVLREVLKQRIKRSESNSKKADPDYWETSKPLKKYQMKTGDRTPPIEKNVEYIDFRSELSAFDSYMYFTPLHQTITISSKQDYIRRYSKKIKEAFDSKKEIELYGKVKNKKVQLLSDEEIKDISLILGKTYSSIELLDHQFLKNWGFSVRLSSPSLSYTEAFAGSGETAIIILVHKIHNCPKNTLLLLDEPETSLHPGAQKRLRDYLLNQIKAKKLQIIISTHSPFFIEDMPATSIKVFSMNKSGKFHIENEREPNEAFYELEIEQKQNIKVIIVEDVLAQKIVQEVLNKMGEDIFKSFEIKYLPGGQSVLKQRIEGFLEIDYNPYILFDGDQKLEAHLDPETLTKQEAEDVEILEKHIKSQTGTKINFNVDGAEGVGNQKQKIKKLNSYLKYYFTNVRYLPKEIPEEIIWNDEFAVEKIQSLRGDLIEELEKINTDDKKESFKNLCILLYGNLNSLDVLQHEFIIKWLQKSDSSYLDIQQKLTSFRRE